MVSHKYCHWLLSKCSPAMDTWRTPERVWSMVSTGAAGFTLVFFGHFFGVAENGSNPYH